MEAKPTIKSSCAELLAAISPAVARTESLAHGLSEPFGALDNVSRSLSSLRTGLEGLQADAAESQKQLPRPISQRLCAALSDCNAAVVGVDGVLQRRGASGSWESNGEAELQRLTTYIDGHTSVLGVVVDMVKLVVDSKAKGENNSYGENTGTVEQKLDVTNSLGEVAQAEKTPSVVRQESESGTGSNDVERATLEEFFSTNPPPESRENASGLRKPSFTPPPIRLGKSPLFSGNLVIDIPLPPAVLLKVPHGERDEFTHVRYSAVTCQAQSFSDKKYTLRASLFAKPRVTDVLLSIYIDHAHSADLPNILTKAYEAIDYLVDDTLERPSILGSDLPAGSAWKRVVLHLHLPTRPDPETTIHLDRISARPTQWDDSGPWSSKRAWGTSSFLEKDMVNGEAVLWHMYEYTTQLRLQSLPSPGVFSHRSSSYTTVRGRVPVQTIVTHGRERNTRGDQNAQIAEWMMWKDTLKSSLRALATVYGESESAVKKLKRWTLAKAWRNRELEKRPDGYQVRIEDLWDWSDKLADLKALVSG